MGSLNTIGKVFLVFVEIYLASAGIHLYILKGRNSESGWSYLFVAILAFAALLGLVLK